ncbi:MAG: hypothetical protein LBM60_02120 [Clostridium sp.]|nr:hypothetical protein [Clostridium sp.]
MIDSGTLTSESPQEQLNEFLAEDNEGQDNEGQRKKIIIVLNRMDLRSDADRDRVWKNANAIFEEKCARIVGISAKKAFEARTIKNNNDEVLVASNIKELENAINEVFLSNADDRLKSNMQTNFKAETFDAVKVLLDLIHVADDKYKDYQEKKSRLTQERDTLIHRVDSEIKQRINAHIDMIEGDLRNLVGITRMPSSFDVQMVFRIDELNESLQNVVSALHKEAEETSSHWQVHPDFQIRKYKYLEEDIDFLETIPLVSFESLSISEYNHYSYLLKSRDFGFWIKGFVGTIKNFFRVNQRRNELIEKCRDSCYSNTASIRKKLQDGLEKAHKSASLRLLTAFQQLVCNPENVDAFLSDSRKLIEELSVQPHNLTIGDIIYRKKAV